MNIIDKKKRAVSLASLQPGDEVEVCLLGHSLNGTICEVLGIRGDRVEIVSNTTRPVLLSVRALLKPLTEKHKLQLRAVQRHAVAAPQTGPQLHDHATHLCALVAERFALAQPPLDVRAAATILLDNSGSPGVLQHSRTALAFLDKDEPTYGVRWAASALAMFGGATEQRAIEIRNEALRVLAAL